MVGNRGSVFESDFYTILKKLHVQEGEKYNLFADHVTLVYEAHNWVIVSFLQQVQGGTRLTAEGSRENIGHNVHVWGDRERNTRLLSVKAGARRTIVHSDGKLGTTIQDPPAESGRRTHLLNFTYFVLHSVTCPKTCHLIACLTSLWTSISVFYVNTVCDVVTTQSLLIFAKYLALYQHIFTSTYRSTHTQAHMYNQHTRGMATTRHRSLIERGGRKAFVKDKGLAHTRKRGKNLSKKNRYLRI